MSLGQVQKVLVCQSSQSYDSSGACPPGTSLVVIDAYILAPSSQEQIDQPIDYQLLGQYFAFGFSAIIIFWSLGKGISAVFRVLR